MSSRTNLNSAVDVDEKPEKRSKTSETVTCFWSSTDPDWYDDYAGGDAA